MSGVLTVPAGRTNTLLPALRPSTWFVLAVLTACYAGTFIALAGQWYTNQAYSYAFVVPLISAFVAHAELRRGPVAPLSPDYLPGGIGLLLAMMLFTVGQLGSILALQEVSLGVAVVACVLFVAGRSMIRRLWFPLAYLFLMVPIWDRPIDFLHSTSQHMSARIATWILHSLDIPALRTETFIILPTVTLEVARECSGINQLIAVFAIALPASYLVIEGNLRRLSVVAFALAVALVSNGVRIGAIGGGIHTGWIGADVHGPYHILQGLAVSCVGFVVIAFSLLFFANRPRPIAPDPASAARPLWPVTLHAKPGVEVAMGLVVLAVALLPFWFTPVDVPLTARFDQFPKQVGKWTETWTDQTRSSGVLVEGADDELLRTFRTDDGRRVQLYVAYFRQQKQSREIVGASTQSLVEAASPITIALAPDTSVELNQAIRKAARSVNGAVFWFDINGRRVIDPYQAKFYSVVDAILHRRTNGAVVIVSWDSELDASTEIDPERRSFVSAVIPLLQNYLPS